MRLPCSYQTRVGTPCQAPALKDSDPPACISHDPRPKTQSLKRAAVRKGGQQVWARQHAQTQTTTSRVARMRPLLEAVAQNPTLSVEARTVLLAAVDEFVRAARPSEAARALDLLATTVGLRHAPQAPEDQPPSHEEMARGFTRAIQICGWLLVCPTCQRETAHRSDLVCGICGHVTPGRSLVLLPRAKPVGAPPQSDP